jgi:multiple antibiotic resistance protein
VLRDILEIWGIPFVSIFFVVDPLAVIPAFLSMTADDPPQRRRAAALKASIAAFLILAGFAAAGGLFFKAFGVTLPAFRIAGGIILGLSALEMLRADMPTRGTPAEIREGVEKPDVAVTPLAMPLLAGPGAIATVMVLTHRAPTWRHEVPVYAAILATTVLTFVLLRLSERLNRLLGRTGINVLGRLMGLVLAALSVQFILDGLRDSGLLAR